jgi:hypothetical protein
MRLRKTTPKTSSERRTKTAKTTTSTQADTAKWTNGSFLGSKGVSVLVLVALVCGPIALVSSLGGRGQSAQSAPAAAPTTLTSLQQSAGSFAVGYVGAWLGASQDNSDALSDYTSTQSAALSPKPFSYRNAAVASLEVQSRGNMVTAVVAADVQDASLTTSSDGNGWPRRYFQVTVSTVGNRLTAVGLPAPIAGPSASSDVPSLDYRAPVATSDPAGQSVVSFLTAYLTGQGSVQPYTSPSVTISGITPAPYASLTPVSIAASEQPAAHPSDGTKVSVLATVTLQNSIGQKLSATYELVLRARADRWEIFAIESAPNLAPVSNSISTTTPTPTPTGAGNKEGK